MPSFYGRLRLAMLPFSKINEKLPRNGTIVDLGCGQGAIASALAEIPTRQVIGIDLDASRIDLANRKNRQPNLSFRQQDLTRLELGHLDGAIISDVLHHVVPVSAHRELLEKIYLTLANNGVLIIKDVDSSEFVRAKLSRLWDRILYPKDVVHYHHWRDLIEMLENIGFSVEMSRETRLFPGSTTLYVCSKTKLTRSRP